eukprot:g26489.t1
MPRCLAWRLRPPPTGLSLRRTHRGPTIRPQRCKRSERLKSHSAALAELQSTARCAFRELRSSLWPAPWTGPAAPPTGAVEPVAPVAPRAVRATGAAVPVAEYVEYRGAQVFFHAKPARDPISEEDRTNALLASIFQRPQEGEGELSKVQTARLAAQSPPVPAQRVVRVASHRVTVGGAERGQATPSSPVPSSDRGRMLRSGSYQPEPLHVRQLSERQTGEGPRPEVALEATVPVVACQPCVGRSGAEMNTLICSAHKT